MLDLMEADMDLWGRASGPANSYNPYESKNQRRRRERKIS